MGVFDYDKNSFEVKELDTVVEAFTFKTKESGTWTNINGLNHINEIKENGNHFNLHPLISFCGIKNALF